MSITIAQIFELLFALFQAYEKAKATGSATVSAPVGPITVSGNVTYNSQTDTFSIDSVAFSHNA